MYRNMNTLLNSLKGCSAADLDEEWESIINDGVSVLNHQDIHPSNVEEEDVDEYEQEDTLS